MRRVTLKAVQLEARENPAVFAVDPLGSITTLVAGPSASSGGDVVLIESSIPGADAFVRSVAPGSDAVLLDAHGDGLFEARAILAGRHDLGTVSLVSHGGPGFLEMGSLKLDAPGLIKRGADLADICYRAVDKPCARVVVNGPDVVGRGEAHRLARLPHQVDEIRFDSL